VEKLTPTHLNLLFIGVDPSIGHGTLPLTILQPFIRRLAKLAGHEE
jgi:hypothetical protein